MLLLIPHLKGVEAVLKVELYPDRIEVSNHCLQEAEAFINKRFSKDSFSPNIFLMKVLRMANLSEEKERAKCMILGMAN